MKENKTVKNSYAEKIKSLLKRIYVKENFDKIDQNKVDIWCSIYSFIKQSDIDVYMDFEASTFEKRNFKFIGILNIDKFDSLKNKLLENDYKINQFESPDFIGICFEITDDIFGLFTAPKNQLTSFDQKLINSDLDMFIMDELQLSGKEKGLKNLSCIDFFSSSLIKRGVEWVISKLNGISTYEIRLITYENSHKEYIRNYLNCKNNKDESINNLKFDRDNIENFTRQYYNEIKIIGDLFKGQSLSIHDAGTNVAQFPLLVSYLSQEELFGINISRIIASDYAWTGEEFINRILKKDSKYKHIEFLKLDLINDLDNAPMADVVILNDVLEHLPDDITSFNALKGLWDKTGKLLIAHVPFEEVPDPLWEHHISFNENKLREWASKLPEAVYISDKYIENDKTLTNYGFLAVKKL